jgi:hypothetical protein
VGRLGVAEELRLRLREGAVARDLLTDDTVDGATDDDDDDDRCGGGSGCDLVAGVGAGTVHANTGEAC